MPRPRTWRRSLRALAPSGRARAALSGDSLLRPALGPEASAWREDTGPLHRGSRPRQGALGDCWVVAAMLAIHETSPERLASLVRPGEGQPGEDKGIVEVHLPGLDAPLRVDRTLPVDARGRFLYARRHGANPADIGVLEKAIAGHVAGGYGMLQRGLARYGLQLLLGETGRMTLRSPDAARVRAWQAQGRPMTASTHPLSARVRHSGGAFRPNHVYALVGATPGGQLLLRDPGSPDRLLRVDAQGFRRAVLTVDIGPPLR